MPGSGLSELLAQKKDAIVRRWLDMIVASYPEDHRRFLTDEKDGVRNPVGAALKKVTRGVVEGFLAGEEASRLAPQLDEVIRIRAVQDFTASEGLAFVFALKKALREEAGGACATVESMRELAQIEARIDGLALAAFDAYTRARERMSDVRVSEMKRRVYLLERMHPVVDREPSDPAPEGGPPEPANRGGVS